MHVTIHKHFPYSHQPDLAISIVSVDINITMSPDVSCHYMPFFKNIFFSKINNHLKFFMLLVFCVPITNSLESYLLEQ